MPNLNLNPQPEPGRDRDPKKKDIAALLRRPGTIIGAGVGMFLLLVLYIAFQADVSGDPTAGGKFVPPSIGGSEGMRSSLVGVPSRRGDRLPVGMEMVRAAGGTAAGKAGDGGKAGAGGKGGEGGAGEGGLGEVGEVPGEGFPEAEAPQGEEGNPLEAAAQAMARGPGGLQSAGLGSRGNFSQGGAAGASGGSASIDGSRLARAGAPAAPLGAARAAAAKGPGRAFSAVGGRGGPSASGGPGSLARNRALNSASTPGGNPRFGASAGGGGASVSAAPGSSGLVGGAGGSPIGGAGGSATNVGGGATVGTQNPGGNEGGGVNTGNGDPGSKIQNFAGAVAKYESQEALVQGRNFIECLIRAYHKRYTHARDQVDQLAREVDRTIVYFEQTFPSAVVVKTLKDLKTNLEDQGGLLTSLRNAVRRLKDGGECFKRDQNGEETQQCYETFQGPIIGLDLNVQLIDGFHKLVDVEGRSAMDALGQPVQNDNPQLMCPGGQGQWYYAQNCHYPGSVQQARQYLEGQIRKFQQHLTAAKDPQPGLNGLRWGNEKEVLNLANKYVGPHTEAQMRLNDIPSSELPRKKQPEWEEVQRNANLSLGKANTAWGQIAAEPTQQKKIVKFLEAHRETQYAANDLVRGTVVLGLRPAPPEGKAPSSQFSPVAPLNVDVCDVPPPPPPPGGGKK